MAMESWAGCGRSVLIHAPRISGDAPGYSGRDVAAAQPSACIDGAGPGSNFSGKRTPRCRGIAGAAALPDPGVDRARITGTGGDSQYAHRTLSVFRPRVPGADDLSRKRNR